MKERRCCLGKVVWRCWCGCPILDGNPMKCVEDNDNESKLTSKDGTLSSLKALNWMEEQEYN
jgi:hypothetical protein